MLECEKNEYIKFFYAYLNFKYPNCDIEDVKQTTIETQYVFIMSAVISLEDGYIYIKYVQNTADTEVYDIGVNI